MTANRDGKPPEGWARSPPPWLATVARRRHGAAAGSPAVGKCPAHAGDGEGRGNLGEEQSPWEERVVVRWKRRPTKTDSSMEKRPEVKASSGAVLTAGSGNGPRGRDQGYRSAGVGEQVGFARRLGDHTRSIGPRETHFGVWRGASTPRTRLGERSERVGATSLRTCRSLRSSAEAGAPASVGAQAGSPISSEVWYPSGGFGRHSVRTWLRPRTERGGRR